MMTSVYTVAILCRCHSLSLVLRYAYGCLLIWECWVGMCIMLKYENYTGYMYEWPYSKISPSVRPPSLIVSNVFTPTDVRCLTWSEADTIPNIWHFWGTNKSKIRANYSYVPCYGCICCRNECTATNKEFSRIKSKRCTSVNTITVNPHNDYMESSIII